MEKSDRCRAPPGARADDWDSGDDESYTLRTLSSRRRRRQEHVHRPIRHRTRRQLNKFACLKCQLKKTKVRETPRKRRLLRQTPFLHPRRQILTEPQVRRRPPLVRRLCQAP